ncbi:uncharacterized protein Dwil_GK14242 [Drosophila willistoni]|uniref:Uncharacterized protein n=1 Tax=Drosophila willistoni TaxID=7260 RepID=A0A0Q9X5M8_DROWI|nr:uncharacterized protein LOC6650837 [Drosophila willistoni]KRG00097.1 uncharacterized protein Dwil_GK14242 [Drosophila willistoni]
MCVRNALLSCLWFTVAFTAIALAGTELTQVPAQLAHVNKCGNTQKMVDECFNDLPAHLMDFLQNTKTVISKKEITAKCNIFNRGMKCFDDYSARCLQNRKLNTFKNNVEGARKFFYKFCGDTDFQKDYLRHKDCFAYIQMDWVSCTAEFEAILTDEINDSTRNTSDKFADFCCARHAYENCIYTSARYKCYKNSAEFARETAKMLSDGKHFRNCDVFENVCAKAASLIVSHWLDTQLGLLLLLFIALRIFP